MPRKRRDPFEVKLAPDKEQALTEWLAMEIDNALTARATLVAPDGEIDYWHKLYEGGDRTIRKMTPFPDAANLTSYIGTEKVDALRSRILKTIYVEPIWTVEGWGRSAARAPFVEEFHQWKAEEERLQGFLARWVHNSLIETAGVLEVYEHAERRKMRHEVEVLVATNEQGAPVLNADGSAVLLRGADGNFVLAEGATDQPTARAVIDDYVTHRRGPRYRIIPVRDFLMLPGHAIERDDLWGYAKRFWRRVPELTERETQGYYKNVDRLGEEGERDTQPRDIRAQQDIALQRGPTAEKELWEVLFKRDLDDDQVEEWYVATLHVAKRVLLRLQYDDGLGTHRYILGIPFPRSDSVWGYSLIGHKLITIIEEHTVTRNQIADRSSLVNAAPVKRQQGALWDPEEQPWGPRAVIDVRDMNEVQAVQIPDVPASIIRHEQNTLGASERVAGVTDTTLGVHPNVDRTLGEVQLVTEQSFVRMEEIIRHIQEAMEDLWQVRHLLWIRALEDQDEEPPAGVIESLEMRGLQLERGAFTAQLLRGNFRGKPRGSVETADLNRLRADFNGFLKVLAELGKVSPALAQKLQDPQVQQSLFEQAMRVYRWPDRHTFLGRTTQEGTLETMTEGAADGNGAGISGGAAGQRGLEAVLGVLRGGLGASAVPPAGAGVAEGGELAGPSQ